MVQTRQVAYLPRREPGTVYIKVEGCLFPGGVRKQAAYLAANAQSFSGRILKLTQIGLAGPASLLLGGEDSDFSHRWTYLCLQGMSRDRIETLAEEYFEKFLKREIQKDAADFFQQLREQGHPLVFLSAGLDCFIHPVLEFAGFVNGLHCNQLEYKDGFATGRLLDPVVGGNVGSQKLLAEARAAGVALEECFAYGSEGSDFLLLSSVGKPCAVNPDLRLRRTAREMNWPIMEF